MVNGNLNNQADGMLHLSSKAHGELNPNNQADGEHLRHRPHKTPGGSNRAYLHGANPNSQAHGVLNLSNYMHEDNLNNQADGMLHLNNQADGDNLSSKADGVLHLSNQASGSNNRFLGL